MTAVIIISLLLSALFSWLWGREHQARITAAQEAEAWRIEQESITQEERAAAADMLMDTLSRWPHPLTPEQWRRSQTKAYALAAMQWKKMGADLERITKRRHQS